MVSQFYIIEISRNAEGELAHDVSWVWDDDAEQARLKAESAYYAKLSQAAVSNKMTHSVTLITDTGVPVMNYCYKHNADPEPEPEPEPETGGEETAE